VNEVEVTFPLTEDINMDVSSKYGMIASGESNAKAVRAVFVIDPAGTIRTIIYYPLSLGRNFDKLYRILIGLQTADTFSVATSAYWHPGDEAIVPTVGSCGVAKEHTDSADSNVVCHDWFFCMRKLDKETVLS